MQRASDFRAFTENLHPLESAIDLLPDLPEGVGIDYLQKVSEAHPVAENPFEESELRESGLKIWDSVYLSVPRTASLDVKRPKDISTLRSINSEWESTKESLGMVGRPDGVHYLRPKGKYIFDLMNDDIRMIQGAHILAHRETTALADDDYTFGETGDVFLRNMIRLFLARTYGLLVNVHPEMVSDDSFSRYGLDVCGSTDLRAPSMMFPYSRLTPDRSVSLVLGSVGIEAHPKQAEKGTAWREINKWSCLPTLVALAGWECVDYLTHVERAEIRGEPYYAASCSDLQPMSRFEEFLSVARETRGVPTRSEYVMTVGEWLDSDDFRRGLAVTPQLPCPHCIRINDKAEGAVRRPRSKKPRADFRDVKDSTVPEIKEWVDYVTFMRNCISIGRTATAYALGSVTSVKRRNAEFLKRTKKIHRIGSLTTKFVRKMSSGFVSEAEAINSEIEKLRKELEQ